MKKAAALTFFVLACAAVESARGHGTPIVVDVNSSGQLFTVLTDENGIPILDAQGHEQLANEFRADLVPLGSLLTAETIPGYQISGIGNTETIGIKTLGKLWYWNGTDIATVPTNDALMIDLANGSAAGAPISIDKNSGPQAGFVFDTGPVGHTHFLEYFFQDLNLPIGEYGVAVQLFSSSHGLSNPFVLAFNNGLSDAEADNGLDAITAVAIPAVPEPSAALLLVLGGVSCACGNLFMRLQRWSGNPRRGTKL